MHKPWVYTLALLRQSTSDRAKPQQSGDLFAEASVSTWAALSRARSKVGVQVLVRDGWRPHVQNEPWKGGRGCVNHHFYVTGGIVQIWC